MQRKEERNEVVVFSEIEMNENVISKVNRTDVTPFISDSQAMLCWEK